MQMPCPQGGKKTYTLSYKQVKYLRFVDPVGLEISHFYYLG